MIGMTMSRSTGCAPPWGARALPARRRPGTHLPALPVMVGNSTQTLARGKRVDVEHIVTRLRIVGRTRITTQTPRLFRGHRSVRKQRIARNAAQEIQFDLLLARLILHADV